MAFSWLTKVDNSLICIAYNIIPKISSKYRSDTANIGMLISINLEKLTLEKNPKKDLIKTNRTTNKSRILIIICGISIYEYILQKYERKWLQHNKVMIDKDL